MSLSLVLRPRQVVQQSLHLEQRLRIRLSPTLKLRLASHRLALRTELIGALNEERFQPLGDCPACNYHMTPLEILKGFSADPTDLETTCPKCKVRFRARLVHYSTLVGSDSRAEVAFYCPSQTLDALGRISVDTPMEEFRTYHAAIYQSAVFHFGGLRQAYAKIGKVFDQPDLNEWRTKVLPFLGKLPDSVIAECAGVSADRIRRLRLHHKIKPCSQRTMLRDAIRAAKANAKQAQAAMPIASVGDEVSSAAGWQEVTEDPLATAHADDTTGAGFKA